MDLHPSTTAPLLAFGFLASIAAAQAVHTDVPHGKAEATGQVRIQGPAGAPYMLWWGADEGLTTIGDVTLFVDPLRSFESGLHIEGFLDVNGVGTYEFPIGLEWDGDRISFQAVVVTEKGVEVSNLARGTWQVASEFRDAVGIPASFSILGDLYTLPDGRVLSIGGAGPVVEAYEPWTQQTVPLTLVQPMHLLSARAQLADGTILLAGGAVATTGQDKEGNPTLALSTTNEAYVFDPASGVLTPTAGTLTTARAAATATRLSNGKVLVCGGFGSLDVANPLSILTGILASTELYDPATGLFTTGPAMLEGKALHTATTLDNGQVMIAGGLGSFLGIPTVSNTAYFYNPATNAFGLLPKTFTGGRFLHNATRLADGRVILTGGITADLTGVIESGDLTQVVFGTIPSTAIFNPSAGFGGSFSAGQSMLSARALHTSTLLPGGALLVTGGLSGDLDIGAILSGNLEGAVLPVILDNCELLTFNPNASAPAAYLSAPRAGASAIVSPMDGRVIVLGGGPLLVELYQP